MNDLSTPITFQPALRVADPLAAYWLRQVTLRLRREICWLWRERGLLAGAVEPPGRSLLPPYTDRLGAALDMARYDDDKRAFFADDETARWLTDQIQVPAPAGRAVPRFARGGFGWAAAELDLAPVDCFALALALEAMIDGAAGTVFAACLNDPARVHPTAALAQRLWDRPEETTALADPGHPLYRHGLLNGPADWDAPLAMPAAVARQLAFPDTPLPASLVPVAPVQAGGGTEDVDLAVARIRTAPADRLRLQPLLGQGGVPLAAAAARVAAALGGVVVQPAPGTRPEELPAFLALAWLRGAQLYLPFALLARDPHPDVAVEPPLPALPATLFVGLEERGQLGRLPPRATLPTHAVPALDYAGRLACWRDGLGIALGAPGVAAAMADCARRFRYEAEAIERVCRSLHALGRPPRAGDLYAACRGDVDLGDLAQRVVARFAPDELMLPARQSCQIRELTQAAAVLTRVHHEWGTALAWNESGLSALFAGAPGTGKTMAAEVISRAVGMPLYRIDLSQVVNKYIGETEKNLRRLFDAADAADVILFFDEADALFGKRTAVRDAHDRYANLEVSYLLERMERFKGMAILATNRKKDLDEAFLRRLRFVIDFPLPGEAERLAIWRRAIPAEVDATDLDFAFLAQRFALAGGHIRSIVFQACLQSAAAGGARRLEMATVVQAVRREIDKLGRAISFDQFGPWAACLEE